MLYTVADPHPHALRGVVLEQLPHAQTSSIPIWVCSSTFPAWAFTFGTTKFELKGIILVNTAVEWKTALLSFFPNVPVLCKPTHLPPTWYDNSVILGDEAHPGLFFKSLPWLQQIQHVTYLGYGLITGRKWRGSRRIINHSECGGCTTDSVVFRFFSPNKEWNRQFRSCLLPCYPWTSVSLHLSSASSVGTKVKAMAINNEEREKAFNGLRFGLFEVGFCAQ